MWQEKRQMARMTGETFWKEEMKIKRCEEQDESSKRAHTYPYTYCLLSTVLYALCQGHKLQLCQCIHTHTHTHPVHTPCIISLFDALALKLIGMLESVTAYIITMMEMSLSGCVLWVTRVLLDCLCSVDLHSYTVCCATIIHKARRQI